MAIRFIKLPITKIEYTNIVSYDFMKEFQEDRNKVFAVYHRQEFVGIISYKEYFHYGKNVSEMLSKDTVSYGKNMWSKVRNQLRKSEAVMLPILDEQGEVDVLCWDDSSYAVSKLWADCQYLYRSSDCKIGDILQGRNIKFVKLSNVDELSCILLFILLKEGIEVGLYGERWRKILTEDLLEKYYNRDAFGYSDTQVFNFAVDNFAISQFKMDDAANITDKHPDGYKILQEVCDANYNNIYFQGIIELQKKFGSRVKLVYFPNIEEVSETCSKRDIVCFYRKIDVTEPNLLSWEKEILKESVSKTEWEYYLNGIYGNGIKSVRDKVTDIHIDDIINITDGARKTIGQIQNPKGKIYFLGTCEILSRRTDDANTIPSLIQRKLNKNKIGYNAINYGAGAQSVLNRLDELLNRTQIGNDIIVCSIWKNHLISKKEADLDVTNLHKKKKESESWYLNDPSHLLTAGNHVIAHAIYEKIL